MSEKTILVVPGKKLTVPRVLKRSMQVAAAVGITAGVALAILIGNGLLVPRGRLLQGWDVWSLSSIAQISWRRWCSPLS